MKPDKWTPELTAAEERLWAAQQAEEVCLAKYRKDRSEENRIGWILAHEAAEILAKEYHSLRLSHKLKGFLNR